MSYQPCAETRTYLRTGKLAPGAWRQPLELLLSVLVVVLILAGGVLLLARYGLLAFGLWLAAGVLFGIRECFIQPRHALVRIYGPLGRMRYLFEQEFRDKFLQYFNEDNVDGRPISRIVRDYVYQKAKGLKPLCSFGTELDNADPDNTPGAHLLHYNFGDPPAVEDFRVVVGAQRNGVRPFTVRSTLNVSAMSFGAINAKAAESLSVGAKGVAYVNTGEGGYGPHGVAGNDVVFQIGTGKFGVGDKAVIGGVETRVLNEGLLVDLVRDHPNIGMVQVKISQGAKPGIGGHLPGDKVTPEIAAIRKIPVGKTVISPSQHAELAAPTTAAAIGRLMDFTRHLRQLTGLPVGIKMCVGRLEEVDLLVRAMAETGEGPDAIQVDGADGGTGAGPNLFVNYVGYGSAVETLAYVDARLRQAGIREKVALSASGRLLTPAHAAVAFAFGADWVDSARGPMLALGCIQSIRCHTNACPTGIATNNPWRMHGLKVMNKAQRVRGYLTGFHHDMLELTSVLHRSDPRDISPEDLRLITHKHSFARYFDPDPWGVMAEPEQARGLVQLGS